MAELGVGDLAKRRDPAWAKTVLVDSFDESIPAAPADDAVGRREMLADLLQRGIDSGRLSESDRALLLDLARAGGADRRPGPSWPRGADGARGHATGWEVPRLVIGFIRRHAAPRSRRFWRRRANGCFAI